MEIKRWNLVVVNSLSRNGLLLLLFFFLLTSAEKFMFHDLDFKIRMNKILWAQLNLTAATTLIVPSSSPPASKNIKKSFCYSLSCRLHLHPVVTHLPPDQNPILLHPVDGFNPLNSTGDPHNCFCLWSLFPRLREAINPIHLLAFRSPSAVLRLKMYYSQLHKLWKTTTTFPYRRL